MFTKTNESSKFKPFSLSLSNGGTVSGIAHIPAKTDNTLRFLPLLVGIHGGTCTAHNFDISPNYTASTTSESSGVPFVAFNRPCYLDSSSHYPIPEDSTYLQEDGKWEHNYIFPALFQAFGKPNDCIGIVLLCHSLACGGAIVASALHAQDPDPKYPLAGLILSGYGVKRQAHPELGGDPDVPIPEHILFPFPIKKTLMLSDEALHTSDPAVWPLLDNQNVSFCREESGDLNNAWFHYWHKYSYEVTVPVMYALGEQDWLWVVDDKVMAEFREAFPKVKRFDTSIVMGVGHGIEWSWAASGWWWRCFGWACEIAANIGIKHLRDGKVNSTI